MVLPAITNKIINYRLVKVKELKLYLRPTRVTEAKREINKIEPIINHLPLAKGTFRGNDLRYNFIFNF